MNELDEIYNASIERIFEMMKFRKINQKTLAEALGVSSQTITDWKNCKSRSFMHGKFMLKISNALQSPVAYLMFGDGPRTNEEAALEPKVSGIDKANEMHLTTDEIDLIRAYRRANEHTRDIVNLTLAPYRKEKTTGTGAL